MLKTTSKKMIPMLILRILWRHADQEHMISMEVICDRLEEEFESEKGMTRAALRKLVSANIQQLNLFFMKQNGTWMEKKIFRYVKRRLQIRISRVGILKCIA